MTISILVYLAGVLLIFGGITSYFGM